MIQPKEYSSLSFNYYTGVGTHTHELVQDALGRGGQIYGDWYCTQDGCEGARIFSNNNKCPACRSIMLYTEISLDLTKIFPNVSSCHLDGVYRTDDGLYFIIDYKTTKTEITNLSDKETCLPYPTNVAQITGYAALLELRFNIKVSGWILFYIARDNPLYSYKAVGSLITTKEKKAILVKIKTYSDHYGIVMNLTKFKQVQYLIANKPCQNQKQYEKEFGTYRGCPLASICFETENNSRMLYREVERAWEDREPNFLTWKRPVDLPLIRLPKL
jgi:hypothetical protein